MWLGYRSFLWQPAKELNKQSALHLQSCVLVWSYWLPALVSLLSFVFLIQLPNPTFPKALIMLENVFLPEKCSNLEIHPGKDSVPRLCQTMKRVSAKLCKCVFVDDIWCRMMTELTQEQCDIYITLHTEQPGGWSLVIQIQPLHSSNA
jgi:hypothetical protein